MIFSVEYIYVLMGIIGLCASIYTFLDRGNSRRIFSGLFYLVYSVTILFGKVIPPFYTGLMIIVMVIIVGCGGLRKGNYDEASEEQKEASRKRLGNLLFLPALLIPLLTVIGAKALSGVKFGKTALFDPANPTLVALGLACFIAIIVAMFVTKNPPRTAVKESRRLLEAIGWAIVLPQMLATLGSIFTDAGVGQVVSNLIVKVINENSVFSVVAVLCIGMALFTMIMGNAFAAFPVMAAGVAIPLLINHFHANPNHIAALAMFAGYCGTLMTPMAANFNIVPAALLNLKDQNHVIKVQAPTALMILAFNILAMYVLVKTGA